MLLADCGYDADWIRTLAADRGAWANIPPRSNRNDPICFSPYLYRAHNMVERFFNKIKQCRPVATCFDKLAACVLMSPRPNDSHRREIDDLRVQIAQLEAR
jgi:transposase